MHTMVRKETPWIKKVRIDPKMSESQFKCRPNNAFQVQQRVKVPDSKFDSGRGMQKVYRE